MDISREEMMTLSAQEQQMLTQISGLDEMIDTLSNASVQDVKLGIRRIDVLIQMFSEWAEYDILINLLRDLRARVKGSLEVFYKTCLSDRGTTVGMALDFAKFNIGDNCANTQKESSKKAGKSGDKSGR